MTKTHPATDAASAVPAGEPVILDRSRRPISRRQIDPDALKVLYRLHRYGFLAYLVGGAVRDLLLRKTPYDFDLATDARPNQIKRLFRNAFLIGRRFRLAHIHFQGGKVIEVATFRCDPGPETESETAGDIRTEPGVESPPASGPEGGEAVPETKAEQEPGAGRRRHPGHPSGYWACSAARLPLSVRGSAGIHPRLFLLCSSWQSAPVQSSRSPLRSAG